MSGAPVEQVLAAHQVLSEWEKKLPSVAKSKSSDKRKLAAKVLGDTKHILKVLGSIEGSKVKGQGIDPKWPHPFPARMPISVVEYLIQSLTLEDAVVLDPMTGSGTTLVASKKCKRKSFGFDQDPLALLIARTTSRTYKTSDLEIAGERILKRADKIYDSGRVSFAEVEKTFQADSMDFIRFWFPTTSTKQLYSLAKAIGAESEDSIRDFAWLVFSSLIIAKSAGASYALDISRSRPHKREDKPIVFPFDSWTKRFAATIKRHPFMDSSSVVQCTVARGDARAIALGPESVDLVLTSPPYLNAIDYLRSHKFSLVWMGHELNAVRDLRGTNIGSERGLFTRDGIPNVLEEKILSSIKEGRRRAFVRRYLSDMQKVVFQLEQVLRPGGLVVMVVGPTIITRKHSDCFDVIGKLATAAGLTPVGSVMRSIGQKRRSLPFLKKANTLNDRMLREAVIVLRKPQAG